MTNLIRIQTILARKSQTQLQRENLYWLEWHPRHFWGDLHKTHAHDLECTFIVLLDPHTIWSDIQHVANRRSLLSTICHRVDVSRKERRTGRLESTSNRNNSADQSAYSSDLLPLLPSTTVVTSDCQCNFTTSGYYLSTILSNLNADTQTTKLKQCAGTLYSSDTVDLWSDSTGYDGKSSHPLLPFY